MGEALTYFFTPEPLFLAHPDGVVAFSAVHLVTIAICALVIVCIVRAYVRLPHDFTPGSPRRRFLVVCSLIPVALLASRDIAMCAAGMMVPIFWPLHICNFCEYLAVAYALTGSEAVGDVFYPWAMVGGIGALLFPSWMPYTPALTYASLGGFAEHALIVALALAIVIGGDFRPALRRLWRPTLAAVLAGGVFLLVNPLFNTNFFFVREPLAGTPFELLANVFGAPGFLVPYLLADVILWTLMILLARLIQRA